jgi:bifunctional non-homologous end joining protein LigD
MESITLYYRDGRSDKVYQASIEPKQSGFVVNFAYGRRGSTMNTGTKTQSPVSFDEAKKIHSKLIQEKITKGYTQGESGTPYSNPESTSNTGIAPQLLNPVEEDSLEALIDSPDYYLQQKHDGRRLLVESSEKGIRGVNRRGLECGLPETIREGAKKIEGYWIIDGEAVGETLHAFDLLELEGVDLRGATYFKRLAVLMNLLMGAQQNTIRWTAPWIDPFQKRRRFQELQSELAEGVVFKHKDSPYTAGRPASGGAQLKYKFVETASVLVTAINGQRSIGVGFMDRPGTAGNVAIPANHKIPEIGSVVEVRYLYAMPESLALYQPLYLGERDDIAPSECVTSQLKFRRSPEEAAA